MTENALLSAPPKRHGPGRPFQPGQSGNPGGRPSRKPITEALLNAGTPERRAALAETIWHHALKGESWAVQFLGDRLEGKAVARVEQGDPGVFDTLMNHITTDDAARIIAFAERQRQQSPESSD